MGLDMYLKRKVYVGAQYPHRKVEAKIEITLDGRPLRIDPAKISEIEESVGYWRKANAIHAWFVKNVQGGLDNCQEAFVTYEQLKELRDTCAKVLETKDATPLPPQGGFFFGSTDVDEGYFIDMRDTIKIIDALDPEDKVGELYYQSSW